MRLRTFTADTIKDAMALVRDTLGDEVVILSTEENGEDEGGVAVTVAVEEDDPWLEEDQAHRLSDAFSAQEHDTEQEPAPKRRNGSHDPNALPFPARLAERLEDLLHFHQIPESIIEEMLTQAEHLNLTDGDSLDHLQANCKTLLQKSFRFDPLALRATGYRYMLVGLPGIGKTLMIAKMAAQLRMHDEAVTVISTDNKRAGGVEQLETFTRILGIDILVAASRNELRDLLREADPDSRILIDSAGCNPYAFDELKDLGEYAKLQEIEPILVCPAGIDTGEAQEMANVFSFLDIERMVVSRVDTTRRLGSVLAAAKMGDYALAHVSRSSKVAGDLAPLTADMLAGMLVHYKRERMR